MIRAHKAANTTRHLMAGVVILLVLASRAYPSDSPLELSQYSHTAWSTRDGALKAGVRAIAQTPDGYLWLATEFGLIRFDGVRFVPWSPPNGGHLPSTNIRSLIAGRDGTLWIGTLEGLASWRQGELKQFRELAGQNVLTLLEDRDGTVWSGTFNVPNARLCAFQHGSAKCYGDDGSLGQWVWSLYEDTESRLWVGAETGLWQWGPGPPRRYLLPQTIETSQAIAEGAQHTTLLAIDEGVWQLVDGKLKQFPLALPSGGLTTPVTIFRDRDSSLWIGTLQRGLLHVSEEKTSAFAQPDGLSGDRILSCFEDRENNIWVGTTNGLDRFRKPAVTSISMKQGLSSTSVWSVVAARDKSVWASTVDGLNRWKDGHITIYRSAADKKRQPSADHVSAHPADTAQASITEISDPGLPDNRGGSLYEDDRGGIWVSTPVGIARFSDGRFINVKELPAGWVNVITGDNHGGVWTSYQDQGLVHWVGGKIVETVPWSKLGGNVVASSVIADPVSGGLWLGLFQGRVLYFKDGQLRAQYRKEDGLGSGRVTDLELDRDGTLWAATEGGLSRLRDERISTATTANGLPCDTVHWLVEDGASFWLYTSCGLVRIARTEMEKWSADPKRTIRFTILDSSDGVRSYALLTGYTPHVSRSPNGKLWFARFDSVSVLDPDNLGLNEVPPPVHIEQVTADDKPFDATNGMKLPPRNHYLVINFTALSLVAPEKVHFRYKLDGVDRDWREVVNERKVQYSNLGPGRYRFRVKACNNSGVWNETGDTLEFVIPPMWYQTNWFYALCATAFLALLWAAYQLRVRQLAAEFNVRLEERVGERTRIARDLHDTLLQSFQGVLPLLQASINIFTSRPTEALRRLEKATDYASRAITEGRDAIAGLRMSTVEKNDLAVAIETVGEEIAAGQENAAKLQVLVEGTSRELHPILRDEVYRLTTEALRNAFRHAAANNVEVEIRYDVRYFRLRVRDDGKGIDPEFLHGDGREGHYGLHGMRERAKLARGKLTIWTEVDNGTEIKLVIPAGKAYLKSTRPFWYFWKRSGTEPTIRKR